MGELSEDEDVLAPRFAALGFSDKALKEALRNKKITQAWKDVLSDAGDDAAVKHAPLLETLVSSGKDLRSSERKFLVGKVLDGSLSSKLQVETGVKFVKRSKDGEAISEELFNSACGVGISYTPESLKTAVASYVKQHRSEIFEQRYKSYTPTMSAIKRDTDLKWASPGDLKKELDATYLSMLGPKDERDGPQKKLPKQLSVGKDAASSSMKNEMVDKDRMFKEGFLSTLHEPGKNVQSIAERMTEHLKATGGRVFTRFPPEPNGYLHIGHSKAIAINFGYARYHGGETYLRFDDTNPEKEEHRYIVAIQEIVEWLGFKPYTITYASDNFDRLYNLAEDLIVRDKGYVCHCTPEELNAQRGGKDNRGKRFECEHRNRPVADSLEEFRRMKEGHYKPKEAMLRMKQDIVGSGNPQMWDLTAYRILNKAHPRTGDKWKIYPTYDFTHCLCDSFENISHSLCTTEFINSRESYDWLCNVLELYRPQQREYGRLNLTGTIMSKRKIQALVDNGHVRGWDDPRLYTLVGIRRRGVPPGAILSFVNELGVTTAHSNIQIKRFEQSVRRYLEETVPRLMMVLDPIRVVLDNLSESHYEEFKAPFKAGTSMGDHSIPFTRVIYIDRSDFREVDSKDYFRLAPGKSIGLLKVPHTIRATSFQKDSTGKIYEIHAHYENDTAFKKPKTYIQWIADAPTTNSPIKVEARLINPLFSSEDPSSHPGGFLQDIKPDSEEVLKDAMVEVGFAEVRKRAPWPELEGEKSSFGNESVRFQALRVGYFAMDTDSKDGKVVLNRIVTLKEDVAKN